MLFTVPVLLLLIPNSCRLVRNTGRTQYPWSGRLTCGKCGGTCCRKCGRTCCSCQWWGSGTSCSTWCWQRGLWGRGKTWIEIPYLKPLYLVQSKIDTYINIMCLIFECHPSRLLFLWIELALTSFYPGWRDGRCGSLGGQFPRNHLLPAHLSLPISSSLCPEELPKFPRRRPPLQIICLKTYVTSNICCLLFFQEYILQLFSCFPFYVLPAQYYFQQENETYW